MSEPEYEGLSRRQFEALVHALKMFVLLAVPEPPPNRMSADMSTYCGSAFTKT